MDGHVEIAVDNDPEALGMGRGWVSLLALLATRWSVLLEDHDFGLIGFVGVQLQTVGLHLVGDFSHAAIELNLGTGCLFCEGENELHVPVVGVLEDVDVVRADDAD